MAKPFSEWTVLPHGALTRLEENLLSVTGTLRMPPMGDVDRRMTIVRLSDGRLVVYSAIALDEAEMRQIEAFGTPAFLIVPNDIHRMDAKVWKDRYPAMTIIAPAAARAKVEEIVAVDATTVDFGDPSVRYVAVPGTGDREAALTVEADGGTTLVLNDLIFDLANRPGLAGWLFKTIGMTGDEPHMPPLVKMRQVKDKEALRAQLERSHLPNLKRVIISHGGIIAEDAARVLGRIAEELAA
jgi:glyoxylate carboligase